MKNKYKAVFFDRDNTLTFKNQEVFNKYKNIVEKFSGKEFLMDNKKMFSIFEKIKKQGFNTKTYDNEIEFYKQYYKQVLIDECGYENELISKTANDIFDLMWLNDRSLYSDVIPVFKKLKECEIKIGIISDTTLSLQKTLESLGLGKFIDCYTSSTEVGIMKPDPKIYLTAISKLNLNPEECIYVDDFIDEVIGAANLGLKAFRINRNEKEKLEYDIFSLEEIIKYIEQ